MMLFSPIKKSKFNRLQPVCIFIYGIKHVRRHWRGCCAQVQSLTVDRGVGWILILFEVKNLSSVGLHIGSTTYKARKARA
jgi:hypothetical protein